MTQLQFLFLTQLQFLQVAAPLMGIVSVFIMLAGFVPSLNQSKVFNFLCAGLAFVTAVAYGALAVLGGVSWAPWIVGAWLIVVSVKFTQAVLFTN